MYNLCKISFFVGFIGDHIKMMYSNLSFLVVLITKPGALLASTVQFKMWCLYLLAVNIICNIYCSVVTVSKILPLVGFGRFCKKNSGFWFGFGSHNKRTVNRFMPTVTWYENFHHH